MYIVHHGVEYDSAKHAANMLKHGVGVDEAATCFLDPRSLTLEDEAEDEPRWLLFGVSERGRILALCFTIRGELVRLISARKATSKEKSDYAR